MSLIKKRNVHPAEFKAKIALEAIRGAKTIIEIAQDYGVHPVTVSQWKKEMQDQAKSIFEGKRGPVPVAAHSAPERLYGEIGRLKMEVDWLKKKSGFSPPWQDRAGLAQKQGCQWLVSVHWLVYLVQRYTSNELQFWSKRPR